jgi:hypothetical protein
VDELSAIPQASREVAVALHYKLKILVACCRQFIAF